MNARTCWIFALWMLAGWAVAAEGGLAKTPGAAPAAGAASAPAPAGQAAKVREAAVPGLFYPADPKQLAKTVDALLAAKAPQVQGEIRAMICPHAGYDYSGITAGMAYGLLRGRKVRTAIILAPSHTAAFTGASIPDAAAYRTPLGLVRLSPKAAVLAKQPPFVRQPKCRVMRPGWWRVSPKAAPPDGQDTPHTWEHSLEVQLPFLQRALKDIELVPVVFGQVDPAAAGEALLKHLDDKTVVIASSDLSHYHPYDVARSLDAWCRKAVREMDLGTMAQQEACGRGPILAVMHLAKAKGWKPVEVDYRTSGDAPKGDKSAVVGYMSVVFVDKAAKP
jgi:hypothetical protein